MTLGALAPAGAEEAKPARRSAEAPRAACPPREPRVVVQVLDPEPVVSAERGMDELHAMTGNPRTAAARHLGLTSARAEWQTEIRLRLDARRPAEGPVCAVPDRVTITLALAEHVTRIARELPESGCLFQEVAAHERRHVAVNRATLRDAAVRTRAAAEAWARTAEGHGATAEQAAEALRDGLRRAIEPAMAAMRAAQARRHAAIDTLNEYRRLARICPEDQQVLAERVRAAPQ